MKQTLKSISFKNALILTSTAILVSACGGSDNDPIVEETTGSVSGVVRDYNTGEPLAGVAITLLSENGNSLNNVATTTTASDGSYQLQGVGISERFLLSAELAQYGAAWDTFRNTEDNTDINLSPLVLQAHSIDTISAITENTIKVDGYNIVELAANSFVDQNGTLYTGEISTRITLIDPSSDPSIMPGDYVTINPSTGETSQIQSFGAIEASFSDSAGRPLQLASGQTATISIPLANAVSYYSAPQTVPLFYFDETRGYWIEEGEAILTSTDNGYVYQGSVSHFSTWNADIAYDSVNVSGCIEDATGNRISNVRVVASGRDYIGSSSAYSGSNGEFTVPVRPSSEIIISSIANAQSDTEVVYSTEESTQMSNCLVLSQSAATVTLTWGENPSDLDTHFFGPQEDSSSEFEVYFGRKTVEVAGTIFDLDVDDVSSYGPEVLTIPNFPLEGTYRYVVHLFSGSSNIKDSPARVELNLAGQLSIFSPEQASGDSNSEYWHAFNLIVDAAGNVSVQSIQEFSNNEYLATGLSAQSTGTNMKQVLNAQSKPQRKQTKYYAK